MNIGADTKKQLYYYMKLGRLMEERIEILYKQGKISGAIYLGRGQEATAVGTSMALDGGDFLAPTHRDLIAHLPRGMSLERIFANIFGKIGGPTRGKDTMSYMGDMKLGVMTPISMLPDGYPVATGAALAFRYKGENRVSLAYCGEGATSRGDFHESLNIASVMNLPVVFVAINNQYAYSTPVELEMKVKDVAQRACAYDIPGEVLDGNNVEEVYSATRKAVKRARTNGGPTLIEAKTMRMRGHAGHDPANYVPKELIQEWEKKDPLILYENQLLDEGVFKKEELKEMEMVLNSEIEKAALFAENSPYPEGREALWGVYSSDLAGKKIEAEKYAA